MTDSARRRPWLGFVVGAGLLVGACSSSDDGATVRDLGADGSDQSDGSSEASGSASAVADSSVSASATADGGYDYVSNVDGHRLITQDVCDIKEVLDAREEGADPDYEAAAEIYTNGKNSEKSDGTMRTLAGQAESAGLDQWMTDALSGSGDFADSSADERAEAIEKGAQNQILVSWVHDEIESALDKAEAGEFDPDSGAPHNWDEAWAFYHGAQPACAPYATADSRAANFGTLDGDETAEANVALLAAMVSGRDALLDSDAEGAADAAAIIERNIVITYSQAVIRYATLVQQDMADGDAATAGVHRMEGLAFYGVIADQLADAGADTATLDAVFDLGAEPGEAGGGDEVRAALEPAWANLDISSDDIGTLQ